MSTGWFTARADAYVYYKHIHSMEGKTHMRFVALLVLLGLLAPQVFAGPIVDQLGDEDFFGFASGALGDDLPALVFDNRAPSDPQFTDYQIRPQSDPRGDNSLNDVGWTHILPSLAALQIESIVLELGTMGIQDGASPEPSVDNLLSINGLDVAGAFDDVDQGLLGSGLVTFTLSDAHIKRVLDDGFLSVFVDGYKIAPNLGDSSDFLESYAIDFSRVTITQVPEPSTLGLIGAGLLGLGFMRRRRAA